MMLTDKIDELLKEVSALSAKNAEDVEQLRLKYLSKKGEINAIIADFRNVAKEEKRELGIKINELKKAATDKINALRERWRPPRQPRRASTSHALPTPSTLALAIR